MLLLALLACVEAVPDREPGDRSPLTAACDPLDPAHCLAPWPSNRFAEVDDSTATGLRLAVDVSAFDVDDDPAYLNRGDGFSRITGVAAAFDGEVDGSVLSWDPRASLEPDAVVQVILIEPGHPAYGERVAFRTELVSEEDEHLVIGRPAQVLAPGADHAFVVLDDIGQSAPREVEVALGRARAKGADEAEIAAYYAPVRQALVDAGVDLERVVRVSDFTSRSAGDATSRLHAMIDGIADAATDVEVVLDSVVFPGIPEIDLVVRGRLTGAPSYVDEGGDLALDADGVPVVVGTRDIEFRVSVPAGEGDYRAVLWGHGTGGNVTDDEFDRELGGEGIAKVNLKFDGWTGEDFVATLLGLATVFDGSARSTAGLMQALAGGTLVLTALEGPLGDALSAEVVAGVANPAAGRRPLTDDVAWTGGSMGGTMGAVMIAADPRLRTAVLNVPGAGWSHMVPYSLLYDAGMESFLSERYDDAVDIHLALVMAQGAWDDVDGGVWADEALATGGAFLLQQSMGDPVLPNLGTELLASALGATQFEPYLEPIVGLESTSVPVTSGAALEQFRVPAGGPYDIHGFAARNTPAGEAAMQQFTELLLGAWAGTPTMSHPEICVQTGADESCDFTGEW